MIGRWDPRKTPFEGVVAAVEQTRHWRPSDRRQAARVTLDDGRTVALFGREPEERLLRRPRRRPVDRDDVAGLAVGDRIRGWMIEEGVCEGVVTHLHVEKATPAG